MSRVFLGSLLVIFGALFLLNSMEMINSGFYTVYLNLFRKYWPGLLILIGVKIIVAEKNPGLAQVLKWILLLLIGLVVFCMFVRTRNWII